MCTCTKGVQYRANPYLPYYPTRLLSASLHYHHTNPTLPSELPLTFLSLSLSLLLSLLLQAQLVSYSAVEAAPLEGKSVESL